MFERRYNWLGMSQRRLLEYPDRKIFLDPHCSTCQSFIEFTIHSCKIVSVVLISPSRFIEDLPDKQRMYPRFLLCTYQFFFRHYFLLVFIANYRAGSLSVLRSWSLDIMKFMWWGWSNHRGLFRVRGSQTHHLPIAVVMKCWLFAYYIVLSVGLFGYTS